jgi:hypothetical protein
MKLYTSEMTTVWIVDPANLHEDRQDLVTTVAIYRNIVTLLSRLGILPCNVIFSSQKPGSAPTILVHRLGKDRSWWICAVLLLGLMAHYVF